MPREGRRAALRVGPGLVKILSVGCDGNPFMRDGPACHKTDEPLGAAEPCRCALILLFALSLVELLLLDKLRQANEIGSRGQDAALMDVKMEQFWRSDSRWKDFSDKLAVITGRGGGRRPSQCIVYNGIYGRGADPSVRVQKFAPIMGMIEEEVGGGLADRRLNLRVYKRNEGGARSCRGKLGLSADWRGVILEAKALATVLWQLPHKRLQKGDHLRQHKLRDQEHGGLERAFLRVRRKRDDQLLGKILRRRTGSRLRN